MNRKTSICIVLVFALVSLVVLGAGAQGKGATGGKLGIIFNVPDLLLNIDNASFNGLSAGLGLKYWLAQKMAVRGVLEFTYNSDSTPPATSDTTFGLSGAFEYHFVKAKVSPYVGGLAGFRLTAATGTATDFGFFIGPMLGAEVAVLDYLGLFAEYDLLLTINEPLFGINLGIGNGGSIGLVIYLP